MIKNLATKLENLHALAVHAGSLPRTDYDPNAFEPQDPKHPPQATSRMHVDDAGSAEIRGLGKVFEFSGLVAAVGSTAVAELAHKPEYLSGTLGGALLYLMGVGFEHLGRE
jgi:hypothetical protein